MAKCWRLKFSLRCLLVFVLVTGIAMGWYVARVRPQQVAVDAILDSGGWVAYASAYKSAGNLESNSAVVIYHERGTEHLWQDFYDEVYDVRLVYKPVGDEICGYLARFPKLRRAWLRGTGITDAGVSHLTVLCDLTELDIGATKIGDSSLHHIQGLTNLTALCIDSTQVTNDGLPSLYGLHRLEFIYIGNTKTTPEAIARLKDVLPDCKVVDY